jgi:PBSX family phage terminase large subunit
VLFIPRHPARSIELAQAPINIWDGGYRSSKTTVSLMAYIQWLASGDAPTGDSMAMVGVTVDAIEENVLPPLRRMLGRGGVQYKQGELRMLGRTFRVLGGETEKAQDRIAGMTLDGAYVDEASRLAKSMWQMIVTRLSKPGARLYATTNPGGPQHWLFKLAVQPAGLWLAPSGDLVHGANPDVARFTLTPKDNPAIDPSFWRMLERQYTPTERRRAIDGEWVALEGAIWPRTMDQVWTGDLPPMRPYLMGVDPGASHPFVAGLVGQGVDDRAYLLSECFYDGATEGARSQARDVAAVRRWLGECELRWPGASAPARLMVDPSALYMTAALRDGGYSPVPADNRVVPGIQWVGALLATDHLRLCPDAPRTTEQMAGYLWDAKAAEQGEDKPVKADDDGCDMLRYVCMDRYGAWRHWVGAELRSAA